MAEYSVSNHILDIPLLQSVCDSLYDVKRFLLQEDIKHLIVLVETDIDYVEGNLKDLVYPDRSEFQNVEGPKEINILLNTIFVKAIENYKSFSKYAFEIVSWFMGDKTFGDEVTKVLRDLEVEYVGDVGVSQGSLVIDYVKGFGLVAGDLFAESTVWSQQSRERMDLCAVSFLTKWMSTNQPHWEEQAVAVSNFFSAAEHYVKERIPSQISESYRHITRIVLSNNILKPVKSLYLTVLQEDAKRCGRNDESHNDYSRVKQMLLDLNLMCLLDIFTTHGIRDSSLRLDWTSLRPLLEECGLKKGQIYEIKSYLLLPRLSSGTESTSHEVQQQQLSMTPGVLLPPSAFTKHS